MHDVDFIYLRTFSLHFIVFGCTSSSKVNAPDLKNQRRLTGDVDTRICTDSNKIRLIFSRGIQSFSNNSDVVLQQIENLNQTEKQCFCKLILFHS